MNKGRVLSDTNWSKSSTGKPLLVKNLIFGGRQTYSKTRGRVNILKTRLKSQNTDQ